MLVFPFFPPKGWLDISCNFCRAPLWEKFRNQEDVDYVLPLLSICRQPNPERIVWPERTNQWGNLLIYVSPHVLSARVVCFFLLIAPVLFTGSRINTDISSLACFQFYGSASFRFLSPLTHPHRFFSASHNLTSNDWQLWLWFEMCSFGLS